MDTPQLKPSSNQTLASAGLFFAVITLIVDAFTTIVNTSRPPEIGSLFFAWITAVLELCVLLPFFLRSITSKARIRVDPRLWDKHGPVSHPILRLAVAGVIFAFCAYYLIVGLSMVDSVTGILAIKTQPISMMIIGAVILKERLTLKEILIGILMLFLIMFITTKGTFQLAEITTGVLILLIVPIFWNIGHTLAKPFLEHKALSVIEFVFIRIAITSFILTILFAFMGDWGDLRFLTNAPALISILSMTVIFTLAHNTWYQTVKRLPLSVASMIVIPSPALTALLAYFITHEPLFYYHYIGIVGEIVGLYALILIQRRKGNNQKK